MGSLAVLLEAVPAVLSGDLDCSVFDEPVRWDKLTSRPRKSASNPCFISLLDEFVDLVGGILEPLNLIGVEVAFVCGGEVPKPLCVFVALLCSLLCACVKIG